MRRDRKSFWRMSLAFVFAVVLAGTTQLILNLALYGNPIWRIVMQIAAGVGLIAYIIAAFHERGLIYAAIVSLLTAILVTIFAGLITPWIVQALLIFGFIVFLGGAIIAGDIIGRPRLLVRFLISSSLGILAGLVVA
ncbi:hypothetical protein GF359_02915, partial [candidate division WOR-3 bacterium]|nr:hypothetical protein [candidate division WOR-3 bacterium]MBD3364145.1 hypothetical protein [candidate division WOR-3 bacterium]